MARRSRKKTEEKKTEIPAVATDGLVVTDEVTVEKGEKTDGLVEVKPESKSEPKPKPKPVDRKVHVNYGKADLKKGIEVASLTNGKVIGRYGTEVVPARQNQALKIYVDQTIKGDVNLVPEYEYKLQILNVNKPENYVIVQCLVPALQLDLSKNLFILG